METSIAELKGKTLKSIKKVGFNEGLIFTTTEGEKFGMWHDQDCCESVEIDEIVGDLDDLVGHPIIEAEESTNSDGSPKEEYDESFTWTFYKLGTKKGFVTIRWYGASNGYYSESVDFVRLEEE